MNILEQISTSYCINGMMGQDSLILTINTEELESDWHLFEQRISALKPPDQNCPSKFNQQSTTFTQPDLAMALEMRGSLTVVTKAKARAATEANFFLLRMKIRCPLFKNG